MPAWRPATYTNKEELEKEIDRYFEETPNDEITITWLALFLWFSERKSLIDYSWKEEFLHTIKKAKMRVEHAYEKRLVARWNGWDVFALKNFDWKDKFETDNRNDNLNTDAHDLSDEQKKLIAQRWTTN